MSDWHSNLRDASKAASHMEKLGYIAHTAYNKDKGGYDNTYTKKARRVRSDKGRKRRK